VIPGPRPSKGHDRPSADRDRGHDTVRPLRSAARQEVNDVASDAPSLRPAGSSHAAGLPVSLTRTSRGWSVLSPAGQEDAADLVEGLSLADLVAEELGALTEPDRTARRSARGPSGAPEELTDPVDARVAALERTVVQLEHALAARVSTERAIGVLAERNRTSPREAFESMRREARSSGRPVAELAREVLTGMEHLDSAVVVPFAPVAGPASGPLEPRATALQAVAAADGRP
jgi:hypothetical protein